jgi:RNA polymerase sigma factor (sigma-70 family)
MRRERPRVMDWQQVVAAHGPMVWATAYRMLGHYQDASDCYQETFMQALRVANREPVRDWASLLRRLATVSALGALRQRYRRRRVGELGEEMDVADAGPGPVQSAAEGEFLARVRGVLANLRPKEAQAFWLRLVEELSYEEVAAAMGISSNEVGVLIHRVRKRLRQRLADFDLCRKGR